MMISNKTLNQTFKTNIDKLLLCVGVLLQISSSFAASTFDELVTDYISGKQNQLYVLSQDTSAEVAPYPAVTSTGLTTLMTHTFAFGTAPEASAKWELLYFFKDKMLPQQYQLYLESYIEQWAKLNQLPGPTPPFVQVKRINKAAAVKLYELALAGDPFARTISRYNKAVRAQLSSQQLNALKGMSQKPSEKLKEKSPQMIETPLLAIAPAVKRQNSSQLRRVSRPKFARETRTPHPAIVSALQAHYDIATFMVPIVNADIRAQLSKSQSLQIRSDIMAEIMWGQRQNLLGSIPDEERYHKANLRLGAVINALDTLDRHPDLQLDLFTLMSYEINRQYRTYAQDAQILFINRFPQLWTATSTYERSRVVEVAIKYLLGHPDTHRPDVSEKYKQASLVLIEQHPLVKNSIEFAKAFANVASQLPAETVTQYLRKNNFIIESIDIKERRKLAEVLTRSAFLGDLNAFAVLEKNSHLSSELIDSYNFFYFMKVVPDPRGLAFLLSHLRGPMPLRQDKIFLRQNLSIMKYVESALSQKHEAWIHFFAERPQLNAFFENKSLHTIAKFIFALGQLPQQEKWTYNSLDENSQMELQNAYSCKDYFQN